jgi:hypothetical protein
VALTKKVLSTPRTLAMLFPDGETQFWRTDEEFAVGDKLARSGRTWIVTSAGNFARDGKALAVTLQPYDESQRQ